METENKMGVLPVKRLIVSMSLPMMISMLVQALYNIVDSMFVSRISEDALTAVTLAFPLQMMVFLLLGVRPFHLQEQCPLPLSLQGILR